METQSGLDWMDLPHCAGAPNCHALPDLEWKQRWFCKQHWKEVAYANEPLIDDDVQRQFVSDIREMLAKAGIAT